MKNKGKKKQFTIEVDDKDICAIIRYQDFLNKHLKEGRRIPSKVLIAYFSLFRVKENLILEEIKERFGKIKSETINDFSVNSEFNFDKKLPFLETFQDPFNLNAKSLDERDCHLLGLIDYIFDNAEKKDNDFKDKKNAILLLNSYIKLYFAQFEGDSMALFSKYKRDVLIGFIIYKLGFVLSTEIKLLEGNRPSNQMLHQSVKYLTSK